MSDTTIGGTSAITKWLEQRRENARVHMRVDPEILEAYVGRYQAEWLPDLILSESERR